MDKVMTLTPAEKSKIENQKQLYVLLRLINLVEQYHNYDKITREQYKAEMPKLLQKYEGFTRVFPNFNLTEFLKNHDIEEQEVLWAKAALEKGVNNDESFKKETYLYMEATAKFIEINDQLALNESNPILNEIKTPIEELLIILKKLHVKIGVEFSQKYQHLQRIYDASMNNRPIVDVLTSTEFNEVKAVIESMYRILQLSMKN